MRRAPEHVLLALRVHRDRRCRSEPTELQPECWTPRRAGVPLLPQVVVRTAPEYVLPADRVHEPDRTRDSRQRREVLCVSDGYSCNSRSEASLSHHDQSTSTRSVRVDLESSNLSGRGGSDQQPATAVNGRLRPLQGNRVPAPGPLAQVAAGAETACRRDRFASSHTDEPELQQPRIAASGAQGLYER